MSRICFVTYEIHPTTWGGVGVLLHHAAVKLLTAGHEVIFLLDIPRSYFDRFDQRDRLSLPRPESCRAYLAADLCRDLPRWESEISNPFIRNSLRLEHALGGLLAKEEIDFVEFFEYCGVGYYSMISKIFGQAHQETILGMRAHNSVELIDAHESTKPVDIARQTLYALERAGLNRSETVLFPSRIYADTYYLNRYRIDEEAVVISEPPKQPFGVRPQTHDDSERKEVISFGRVFAFKGAEQFIHAGIAYLDGEPSSDLHFVLMGPDSRESPSGDSYIGYLRSLVPARFRSRFEFTGHLEHDEARERFAKARFAVFPNLFESFCYSLHEVYDAGIPIVCNDIPAFRNVLKDDHSALFFDGSLSGLLEAMRRMDQDADVRSRLSCPHPISEATFGEFYESPRAGVSISAGPSDPVKIQIVVLVGSDSCAELAGKTLESVCAAKGPEDEILVFQELPRTDEFGDAGAGGGFSWLGRPYSAAGIDGDRRSSHSLRTLDALCVVEGGDVLDSSYFDLTRTALGKQSLGIGFAGSWNLTHDDRLESSSFDLAPEMYPFEQGGRLTRSVLRTEPGVRLIEVFDRALGCYGEIGYLWDAVARFGDGCLLPRPLFQVRQPRSDIYDPALLGYLIARTEDPDLRRRLAALTAPLSSKISAADGDWDAVPPFALTPEFVRDRADEMLNGTTLLRMSLRKLRGKLLRKFARADPGDSEP